MWSMVRNLCQVFALCACMGIGVEASERAFTFEKPEDISRWKVASPRLEPLDSAFDARQAQGKALRFATPRWEQGMPEWPSCEAAPLVRDWRPYDRIALDVINVRPELRRLSMFISDSKIPFRKAYGNSISVPGNSLQRYVLKLDTFPSTVDRSDISIMHLFTERPDADMDLRLVGVTLLKPDEAGTEYSSELLAYARQLGRQALAEARRIADEELTRLDPFADVPALRETAARTRQELLGRLDKAARQLDTDGLSMAEMTVIRQDIDNLPQSLRRLPALLRFQRDMLASGLPADQMLVGVTSSMKKVLPRDADFETEVLRDIELSLARHEWESCQLVVTPVPGTDLEEVEVTLETPVNERGERLAGAEADTVGYVRTEKRPPYKVSHVGWWPDPILRGVRRMTIRRGDLQSFWLRFHAAADQRPGVYRGKVTVTAAGAAPVTLGLHVRVRSFRVPDHTALPTAIACGLPERQMTQTEPFDKMKFVYADFLADYQIDFDHLYRQGAPDWDIITRLHRQGRLVAFNLGNVFNGGVEEEGFEQKMQQTIDRLRPAYLKAKELGLLDYAYIYGFDERGKDQFPILERCAQALRQAFPEVLLMTTSYDDSFGADSVVKTIDAWCPLTPKFDVAKAEHARQSGKYVWWYICCGPHNPHANWFIEYDAIESRLLMGAQTAKFQPDGFLYYATTIWNKNMGIDPDKGPFTDWNPVSWTVYHGDGSLYYCDSKGYPMPSIRLENYRDGQEDYAYACILKEAIRQIRAKAQRTAQDEAWLARAEKALAVPDTLVRDMADYSHDPKLLRAWRDGMADAIETSGLTDLNPWGRGVFGVRGWLGQHTKLKSTKDAK